MILYHGSYVCVEKPDISFSRSKLDFGRGFYVTPIKEQAVSWAWRFKARHNASVVSAYETNEPELLGLAKVLQFKTYSDEWLDFIVTCRRGEDSSDYDLVIGGVANDRVFDTIQLYLDELIDKNEAIKRLRCSEPSLQYAFRTQPIIDMFLRFILSEVVQ